MKNKRSYFGIRQNQSSTQTKGFMQGLVQKILETCERVANIFLHPGANYTYMYNLHTVCKSAHVNGALVEAGSYIYVSGRSLYLNLKKKQKQKPIA